MSHSKNFRNLFLYINGIIFIIVLGLFSCKQTPETLVIPPLVEEPAIKEPVFSISSIMILQAELVNTRLKVRLRIENPNPFPVILSSFEYKLYGEGRFWADGTEKNVVIVPAKGVADKDLFVIMNFIDMKRDLLDKVIAMEMVAYRFTGSVEINAEDMPILSRSFNLEGESEVTR